MNKINSKRSIPARIKICAGASAGGHMNQLLHLLNNSSTWPSRPDFYITTLSEVTPCLLHLGRVYVIGEANRQHILRALKILLRCLKIILKERPDVVISTGSFPIAIFCLLAKIFGARIIWIDSVANIESFSMSGRLVILFSDMFLTQWPDLAQKHKKAEYVGSIV